jgi:hypothetical protein
MISYFRSMLRILSLSLVTIGLWATSLSNLSDVSAQTEATPTNIVVRALAHDAKLIGTGVGGAHIVIKNALTGDVLADGLQKGSTGDTKKIIRDPRERHSQVFDTPGSAGFEATLMLVEPTLVDITAFGPMATPESTVSTTKRMLLVPGRHVKGEGIILELNGFTVEWLGDDLRDDISPGTPVPISIKVTMLCGCPTSPDGLWDSKYIEVLARITNDTGVIQEVALAFSGTTSVYEGSLSAPSEGDYTIDILALDDTHGNFGRLRRSITTISQ